MEKISLYRKYRPKTFDEVYDQVIVTKTLVSAIKNNHLSHSYIFAGNKGSGKTSIAKIFSKAINCLKPNGANPCNECENCKSIDNNSSLDFFELDAASNSGVAEIRSLIDSVNYLPTQLKYKIYVIDEAHMLTSNSWNALLKTIEEPPEYVIFIFATTEYHKIPATIVSRCQRYDFHKIKTNSIIDLIKMVARQEKIKIDDNSVSVIARLSDGAARDALSILDQLSSYSNNEIKETDVNELFGLVDINNKVKIINLINERNVEELINIINDLNNRSINFSLLTSELIEIIMDKLIYAQTKNKNLLKNISEEEVNKIKISNIDALLNLINILSNNISKIKNTSSPKSIFEYTCFICMGNNEIQNNHQANIQQPFKQVQQTTNSTINILRKEAPNQKQEVKNEELVKEPEPIQEVSNKPIAPTINQKTFSTEEIKIEQKQEPIKEPENQKPINRWSDPELMSARTSTDAIIPTKKVNQRTKKIEIENTTLLSEKEEPEQEVIQNTINLENLYDTPKNELDIRESFFAIASNHVSKIKDKYNQILDNLKEFSSIYSPTINNFMSADRFLITSNNGAIVLFENDTEASRFNKIRETDEFNKFFLDSFKERKLVLGVSKEVAKKYRDEYQKLSKKDFKDVKIKKSVLDTKTMLLDILNDDEGE